MSSGQVSETVGQVERELAKIWATPDQKTGAAAPQKVRASTMNLVIVCAAAELGCLRTATDDLAQTHAGRGFLVTLDGRIAPWDITAAVSAICRLEGGASICSDRVELSFGASAATRASSVVSALALAEVPIVVEAASGAPSILVDDLVKRCDRVIVDTALVPATRVAEIARATAAPIADRAWVRSFTWRDLVARFFDEQPSAAREIKRIEIIRTPGGKSDPAALLIGWLASRLGWRIESRSKALDAKGRAIEIALADDARTDLGKGELVAIKIATSLDEKSLDLSVARTDAARTLCWSMAGALKAEHLHPMGFRDETWVLVKSLDDRSCDLVYRTAVLAAADWWAR